MSKFAIIALAAVAFVACDDTNGPPELRTLELAFTGLEPLAGGFHYEGWAIINGSPVTTGKFDVGASGGLVTLSGAAIANGRFNTSVDLTSATNIVITIEPSGDIDAVPAATKILAGAVAGGNASLAIGAAQALGNDFSTASGRFILATPTDGNTTVNEDAGIWFVDPTGATPVASLVLPQLPAGWRYEGWAVINGQPLTTGKFSSPSGADAGAPFSGTEPGPPFPGEDFLRNAPSGLTFPASLRGGMAVISIEPEPDDSPAPFTLKPLRASIATNAPVRSLLTLSNTAAPAPTGTARIR